MKKKYSVRLKDLAEEHELELVYVPDGFAEVLISTPEVNRPSLQLTGFYQHFDPERIQILGRVETAYLGCLSSMDRWRCFEALFMRNISAMVICRGMNPFPECTETARKYNTPLLISAMSTSEFISNLIDSLNMHLAPREQRHGVLVEVYGEGLLLLGESGIGKSETALELIKRGHRLIADDAVEIKRTSRATLIGSAPEIIRHYMELRGVGVINARHIYGVGAVKPSEKIDLVVQMEAWDMNKPYDRLGLDTEYTDILGISVPTVTIPVRPGRNLAVILELAALNNRQKKMGYNAARDLEETYNKMIDEE